MKRTLFVLAVGSIMLAGVNGCNDEEEFLAGDSGELKKAVIQETVYPYVPGELIVKFREGVAEGRKSEIMKLFAAQNKEKILTRIMELWEEKEGITVAGFTGNLKDMIARFKALPEVEYAEPNYIYTHAAVSNDPYYTNGSLWGMYGVMHPPLKTNPYGCQAAEAWNAGHPGATTVYVGVIDEGYMYNHEDLSANAGKNPGEIAGNHSEIIRFSENRFILFQLQRDFHGHAACDGSSCPVRIDPSGGNGRPDQSRHPWKRHPHLFPEREMCKRGPPECERVLIFAHIAQNGAIGLIYLPLQGGI